MCERERIGARVCVRELSSAANWSAARNTGLISGITCHRVCVCEEDIQRERERKRECERECEREKDRERERERARVWV